MLFAITHAETLRHGPEGYIPDPLHTERGLDQLKLVRDLLVDLKLHLHRKIKLLMYPSAGERFKQLHEHIWREFSYITVMRSDMLGDAVARADQTGAVVFSDGLVLPESQFFGGLESGCFDSWKFLSKVSKLVHGDVVLCTGRRFMLSLGVESKSASVYEISPGRKTVKCMIESGKIQWAPL